jgi:hypothetical protein
MLLDQKEERITGACAMASSANFRIALGSSFGHGPAVWLTSKGEEMRFDPELLRDLLAHVEEHATRVHSDLDSITIEGRSAEEVTYHVVLAEEHGLIKASILEAPDMDDPEFIHVSYSVHRLRVAGHDLLGAIREPDQLDAVRMSMQAARQWTVEAFKRAASRFSDKAIDRAVDMTLGLL